MSKVKCVYIIANSDKDKAVEYAQSISSFLKQNDVLVITDEKHKGKFDASEFYTTSAELFEKCDFAENYTFKLK